jgi:hypothetical protein
LLAGMPADLWPALPGLRPVFIAVGAAALAAVVALVRLVWPVLEPSHQRELRWLAAGAAASLVPGLAGLPGSRLLLMPSVGAAAVVATLIVHLGPAMVRGARGLRALAQTGRVWLVVVHALAAPLLLILSFVNMRTIGAATRRMIAEAEVQPGAIDPARLDVAVLYAPDLVAALYPPHILALDPHTRYRSWWTLSIAPHDHELERTDDRSFVMRLRDGRFFESEWEAVFRPRGAPLRPGDRVPLAGLEVDLISPTEVAFHADRSLDDPTLRLLAWRDGRLRRLAVPPVGGRVAIPRSKGLLGL